MPLETEVCVAGPGAADELAGETPPPPRSSRRPERTIDTAFSIVALPLRYDRGCAGPHPRTPAVPGEIAVPSAAATAPAPSRHVGAPRKPLRPVRSRSPTSNGQAQCRGVAPPSDQHRARCRCRRCRPSRGIPASASAGRAVSIFAGSRNWLETRGMSVMPPPRKGPALDTFWQQQTTGPGRDLQPARTSTRLVHFANAPGPDTHVVREGLDLPRCSARGRRIVGSALAVWISVRSFPVWPALHSRSRASGSWHGSAIPVGSCFAVGPDRSVPPRPRSPGAAPKARHVPQASRPRAGCCRRASR